MKVSIIIPVYNVSLYIQDCVQSVLAQTYNNIEIIVVNDHTQDDSMSIVSDIVKETRFQVKIVDHDRNRGLSAARNTGIENSTGDYLYFLDSDDEITPDCISKLIAGADNGVADIVVGDYVVKGSDDYFPPLKVCTSIINKRSEIIAIYMKERIPVMAWNKLVRRDFIVENGLYFKEGLIHEDCLWSFQCSCVASVMSIVKQPTYIYKVRADSIKTGSKLENDIKAMKDVICGMIQWRDMLGLKKNKYVHSFIEEEKLRLLYTYKNNGMDDRQKNSLYSFLSGLSIPDLSLVFVWNIFKCRKCIRDAHYFLPQQNRAKYYWSIPEQLGNRKGLGKVRFYLWYVRVVKNLIRQCYLNLWHKISIKIYTPLL